MSSSLVTLLFTCLLSLTCNQVQAVENNDCFKAAVFEHIIINKYTDKVTDQEPAYYLKKNLDVFKEVAEIAKQNGVQLVVFPEDGIFVSDDRIDALNYVEEIPEVDKKNLVTPCTDSRFDTNRSPGILRSLSCMARDNGLYLVADIGDKVPCRNPESEIPENEIPENKNPGNKNPGSKNPGKPKVAIDNGRCPEDGHYLYNTAVAFDPKGRVVLKYHKYHLFGEFQYDVPPKVEHAILETPFGSFGIFVCFDKMFKDPAISLIERWNQTNLILTTWWFDEMPFFMAPQLHSSFSSTNTVNLIVSNIKRLHVGSTGSGFYSANQVIDYHHDTGSDNIEPDNIEPDNIESDKIESDKIEPDGRPVLLIADIPKTPGATGRCDSIPKRVYFDYMKSSNYNTTQVPVSEFDHVIISDGATLASDSNSASGANFNRTICNGTLCCSVFGKFKGSSRNKFLFGISNKIRSGFLQTGYEWCEEACVLVALDSDHEGRMSKVSQTTFDTLTLTGNGFSTQYVYPSVLSSNYKLIESDDFSVARAHDRVSISVSSDKNVLMTGLYGRCYDKDPPYVRSHFNRKPILVPEF